MIEAPAQKARWQTAGAAVLAYVLVLYGVLGTFPVLGGTAAVALFPICHAGSDAGDAAPKAPISPPDTHFCCFLCAAGHCGIPLPVGIDLPERRLARIVAASVAVDEIHALPRLVRAAPPRGPPPSA